MAIRILELRSVLGSGGGPEKTILLGTARADAAEFEITVCYIRDRADTRFRIGERAAALNIDYLEILEDGSFDRAIWGELLRIVDRVRPDIVHAHDYKTDLLAWLLRRRRQVAIMSTAHGWTGHSVRERRLYYPMDRWLLSRFPRVVAVSSEIKQALVRAGAAPGCVDVILNGIDENAFRRDPQTVADARAKFGSVPGTLVIGAAGRLEPQKRFDLLLDTFADVHAQFPDTRLIIAGEGSQMATLAAQCTRLELDDACRLAGHVDDIVLFHHAIDAFVQSSDYEGTPNAVLEAMALETPLVATAAGGTAELLADGTDGLVVDCGDRRALSAAIARLVGDPAGARDRAQAARRRVEEELSFGARMHQIETVYRELVREAREES